MSATDDVDKMMRKYREEALASRTRFQRFVDTFALIPLPTYFVLMALGVSLTGARLTSLDLALRFYLVFSNSDFLTGFQQSVFIHLWFIPPIPAVWNSSLLTPAAISVLVGLALFMLHFISRRLAYNKTYYLDLGFLTFFLIGLILMFVASSLFATLYYYYPASLLFVVLSITSIISIIIGKPFTFQHVERIYPPSIRELDIYRKIHYWIASFFFIIFVINAVVFYLRFYLPTASPIFTVLFFIPFYFLALSWAFATHFIGWYRRLVMKTPLQRPSHSLPNIVRIVGALIIIYGQLTLLVSLCISPSIAFIVLAYIVAVTLMVSGFGIILVRKWGWILTMIGLLSNISLFWLAWLTTSYNLQDWLASIGNFFVTLSFYPPSDNLLFLALIFSIISSLFLCYLFPKRNYYLL
ncbi:MAG: hypothetical protein QW279_11455 [Candidatus Jordarchaeaceae archaeon]